jgi:chaperone required for assembly of F1-ATPase
MSGTETDDQRARRLLTRQEQTNLPKRFYKLVEVAPVEGGHEIRLDGRPVKTPLKRALVMPGEAMAHAVAAEWDAQKTYIDPVTMMMTKLANTAVDRVHGDEDRIIAEIVQFAGSDLVCYRAEAPVSLVDRQAQTWDPVLDWARDTHGARFICVAGIVHQAQPEPSLERLAGALKAENPFRLTAIHNVTTLTGSALLALMLAGGGTDAEIAWAAAHLDEDWQIEQWGEDAEAQARRAYRRSDFDASVRFLEMAGN